ncbi:MAG: signal peptide peptidase SppA [Anaerolineae bacterium]|jgi:protease-4
MKDRPVVWVFLAFVLGFALPVCSCVGTGALAMAALGRFAQQPMYQAPGIGDAVAVIELEGSISSGPQDYLPAGGITPDRVRALLDQAAANPSVKAVVVRVNSPGGSVVASDEIYHALLSFEKPVVISMGDVAASGGYYIACAGDHVVAHPDTLTGSIGVISQFLTYEGLLDKIGVDAVVIATGPRKGIGSPYRDMTEEEKAFWREILDQVYEEFVEVVAEARELPEKTVRELADGSVYTGQQALELGLVDAVGTRDDAINKAAGLGGIAGEPRVIEMRPQPSFLEAFYSLQSRSAKPSLEELLRWAGMPSLQFQFTRSQ